MSRFLAFRGDAAKGAHRDSDPASAEWPASSAAAADDSEGMLAFQAEDENAPAASTVAGPAVAASVDAGPAVAVVDPPARATRPRLLRERWLYLAALSVVPIVFTGGLVAYGRLASGSSSGSASASAAATGTVIIDAHPAGTVTIDGVARGSTPLSVSLTAGPHAVDISVGTAFRSLPLIVEAGTTMKQDVEFAVAEPPAPVSGQLDVRSDPSGAQVKVDGVARGVTPLKISTMTPGDHEVILSRGPVTIRQTVNVQRGATASVAGVMTEAASAGWVTFKAPVALDILEDGQTIGTTSASRLMLPAGAHRLELRNAAFEIGTTLSVQVIADKTASVTVPVPDGRLSVNATPWANVFVDGQNVGVTPLANLPVPVGRHEIVWRNPERGERRKSVDVTARTPVRVGMDFAQ